MTIGRNPPTDAPNSASVPAGGTHQVNISQWLGTTGSSIAMSNSSLAWVSGAPTKFAVSGTGAVSGQTLGSGKLYLKANTTPSGYTIWTPFSLNGDSMTVTVTWPLYVITSDETPIITAGHHTFTSHIGDPDSPHNWTVDDSRTIYQNPDTGYQTPDNTLTIVVDSGSYTLRLGSTGGYQDIPVCTSRSEEQLVAGPPITQRSGVSTPPGPTPSVVEGCLPGQGGDQ